MPKIVYYCSKIDIWLTMINYSIIIPHKNIPVLLQRCLDTIPEREDIQIIVVDDNSDPDKVNFNDFPGMDRKDIEVVFTKQGLGAGYARNIGLGKAKGKWILFADSDDFFNACFEEAIGKYKDSDYDIIYFDYNCVRSDTLEKCDYRMPRFKKYLEQDNREGLRYDSAVPWAKMISHALITKYNVRFDETKAANDVMFSTYSGHYAKSIAVSPAAIYCATERENSLWYGMQLDSLMARIEVSCRYNRFMKKLGLVSHYRIYTYGWVKHCGKYGYKSYLRALSFYLKNELPKYICVDLYYLLKTKLKK